MNLPSNYYHCFMGNGLDAVLAGYNGSMVPDKVGVDRCSWYKADRYYPEHKLVHAAGRFPMDKPLAHAEGSGWFEIAPLGHTWYEVYLDGQRLEIQETRQSFLPQEGTLYTDLDFGPVHAKVTTFLHATRSLLIEHYIFDREIAFAAWMAPGIWIEDGWDTDPFERVEMDPGSAGGSYDLGETHGRYHLFLYPKPGPVLEDGFQRGLASRGATFTKIFSILDNRQQNTTRAAFESLISPGYDSLRQEHLHFWQSYFAASNITIPDAQFQFFYDASQYHFKAAQNRESGGLPVNNLRRTWSSHVFWDSFFIQHALLGANHRAEALEACRFFERTLEHARRHAWEEFGSPGLKWDWEITHDGRKAYGSLLHMKFQAHNNASYANEIWQYYRYTLDRDALEELYPILEGLATFFLEGIVILTDRGWEIGPLVGVHESPIKVKNEGTSLAGTVAILEHAAEAAALLGKESEFTGEFASRCRAVAAGLRKTLDRLYNGEFFVAAEDMPSLNMSSLAVMYPLGVIPFVDPRAKQTIQKMVEYNDKRSHRDGKYYNFPWSWGVIATILARQGDGAAAWEVIQRTRPTICQFGGMTEVMEGQDWNMQYFGTAQGAVSVALQSLLLQAQGEDIRLFPALPPDWNTASFDSLLAGGLEVHAVYDHSQIHGTVKNISSSEIRRTIVWGNQQQSISLKPGENYAF